MWLPKLKYGPIYSDSESKRLRSFLNKNLPLHRAPIVESFRLLNLYSQYYKRDEIKLWVVIAISHCVRELEITHAYDRCKPDILPSNLYTCKSLVILKLDGEIFLDVPRMVFLPSLKTLKLQSVRYSYEETLQRLLSNCPILGDLSVYLRVYGTTGKLIVAVPSLRRLSLEIPFEHDIDGIVIETLSLEYFKLKDHGEKTHYYLIENMPNLIEAFVDVNSLEIKSFLGSMTSVKHLEICSEVVYDEGFVFNQLEHLKLCRCKEHSSKLLIRLLKDSSNLQVLELDLLVQDEHYYEVGFYWNEPSVVPECILSSLQTLEMTDYDGESGEEDFVLYILQNAAHLKTARITSTESRFSKYEMIQELTFSSRASTTCQLIFD